MIRTSPSARQRRIKAETDKRRRSAPCPSCGLVFSQGSRNDWDIECPGCGQEVTAVESPTRGFCWEAMD